MACCGGKIVNIQIERAGTQSSLPKRVIRTPIRQQRIAPSASMKPANHLDKRM